MAAVTVGTIDGHVQNGGDTQDRRHVRLPITVTTTGDTHALDKPAVRVAWEATDTTDDIAATLSGSTVTFTGTNGSAGFLHYWY